MFVPIIVTSGGGAPKLEVYIWIFVGKQFWLSELIKLVISVIGIIYGPVLNKYSFSTEPETEIISFPQISTSNCLHADINPYVVSFTKTLRGVGPTGLLKSIVIYAGLA
jgi:hypothetical protein